MNIDDKLRQYELEIHTLKNENRELRDLLSRDELTGAYRWYGYMSIIVPLIHAEIQKRGNFLAVECDVDFFKNINDAYGHAEGDRILREFFRGDFREGEGAILRLGGDEKGLFYFENMVENRIKRKDTIGEYREYTDLMIPLMRHIELLRERFMNMLHSRGICYTNNVVDISTNNVIGISGRSRVPENIEGNPVSFSGGAFTLAEEAIAAYFLGNKHGLSELDCHFKDYLAFNPENRYPSEKVHEFVKGIENPQIRTLVDNTKQTKGGGPNDELIFLFRQRLSKESRFFKDYFTSLRYERNIQGLGKFIVERINNYKDDEGNYYEDNTPFRLAKKLKIKSGGSYNHDATRDFKMELFDYICSAYNPDEMFRNSLEKSILALADSMHYGEKIIKGDIPISKEAFQNYYIGAILFYGEIGKHIADNRASIAKKDYGRNCIVIDEETEPIRIYNPIDECRLGSEKDVIHH